MIYCKSTLELVFVRLYVVLQIPVDRYGKQNKYWWTGMCIMIYIANKIQTLLISSLKMMIMLLWPCLSQRHKPLPSTLEIDFPQWHFLYRQLVLSLPPVVKPPLFYSSFFPYSEPNFSALMLLWHAHSYFSSANLAFPVTFTILTFDAISLHVYFPSLKQSRHRNSVLKISNLIFKIRHSAS